MIQKIAILLDLFSFTGWIENTALSVWVRESPSLWAFPFILILHTVGMGFLVGSNIAMDLRVLGFAPRVAPSLFEKFFWVMKVSFVVNAVSGVLLLIAYPTKALTNPLFYIKLALIAIGLAQALMIRNQVIRKPAVDAEGIPVRGKALAATSLVAWVGGVTAGRLLAYTYKYLMSGD
jgi:hypothetical protein